MQTKEVTKMLGINRERIKYFKKQGVFVPEIAIKDRKNVEYTERDVEVLRKLIVLTKSGMTCGDIKKVQDGEWTLQEAIIERRSIVEEEIKRMRGSLLLAEELLENDVEYDSMSTDYFWNEIQQKEKEGETFMDFNDIDYYRPVPLIRIVKCPHCSAEQEVNLEDYLFDETSNESSSDNDMGPDIVYSFDTEDDYECEKCGKSFRVEGCIREYSIGAYDSEHIEVHLRNNEEKRMLAKLASGILDGMVGDEKIYSGHKDVYCGKYIKDGEPVSYRESESSRFFNGKENERVPGKRIEKHYDTDDRKLEFLQKYGWLIDDEDAKSYSAKFKPKK